MSSVRTFDRSGDNDGERSLWKALVPTIQRGQGAGFGPALTAGNGVWFCGQSKRRGGLFEAEL